MQINEAKKFEKISDEVISQISGKDISQEFYLIDFLGSLMAD